MSKTVIYVRKIATLIVLAAVAVATISTPAEADSLGIDVSRWQGTIDWNATSTYASFAIIKAGGSDGEFYTDSQFHRNRDEVRRLGMQRGYYYFAGGGNPIQEAEHFASIVGPLQPGEVVALDFEIDHPDPVGYSLSFMIRTTELLGVKPLLYTNMNRVWGHDWRPVADSGYHLWGAIYDDDPVNFQGGGAWPRATIKQYSSAGQIPGITFNTVDMNVFRGTVDFTAMGWQPPAPPVSDVAATEPPAAEEVEIVVGGEMEARPAEEADGEGAVSQPEETGAGIAGEGYAGAGASGDWRQRLLDEDASLETAMTEGVGATAASLGAGDGPSISAARCVVGLSCTDLLAPRVGLDLALGGFGR